MGSIGMTIRQTSRPGARLFGLGPTVGRARRLLVPILAVLLVASSARGQIAPPAPPLVYFRTASFIGAWTPAQPGFHTLVPPRAGVTIDWMQLVPGAKRVYWSESVFQPPSTRITTYWSARADGADLRGEPDLTGSRVAPSGLWKYFLDAPSNQFARSRLDGSEQQLLGFGPPPVWPDRTPFVDPTGTWIYYFSTELAPPPGTPVPRLALLRGNIATGAVQQLLVPGATGASVFRDLDLVFDPGNARIHVMCACSLYEDNPVFDAILYQLDASTLALIAFRTFSEGEGANPRFTIDPAGRDYYFTEAGGISSPQPIRRLRYADLAVYQPPAPIVLDDPAVGLIEQLASDPAIGVPEPAGATAGWVALGGLVALARRKKGLRRFSSA